MKLFLIILAALLTFTMILAGVGVLYSMSGQSTTANQTFRSL